MGSNISMWYQGVTCGGRFVEGMWKVTRPVGVVCARLPALRMAWSAITNSWSLNIVYCSLITVYNLMFTVNFLLVTDYGFLFIAYWLLATGF